ncbi:uncharacterized protein LOC128520894 [Clarias gariepinus]|uniref:uncharacterized protein LOC128520894 n=1 Tax=Clarias gariepinus TaxID=13013 RepID=UPI00234D3B28|nr:uncharacterized protein LOC128520894 [Clarias gariepinus]
METEERAAVNKPFIVLLNLVAWIILITAVVLGAIHVNECPIHPHIPIYLIVIGVSGIILLMLAYWTNSLDNEVWKVRCLICILLMVIFNIIWFLRGKKWLENRTEKCGENISLNFSCDSVHCCTGSVLIYSIYPPNYNSALVDVPYCNKTLYLFAFWTTTLMYILLAVVFMCGCCYLICLCVCKKDNVLEEAPRLHKYYIDILRFVVLLL